MWSSRWCVVLTVAVLGLQGHLLSTAGGQWYDLFQPPYSQCPTIMIAISCVSANACYIPGGQNGVGFDVYRFNGEEDGAFKPLSMPHPEFMIMAASLGGTVSKPRGCVGGFGVGNGVQYAANATTFLPSLLPSLLVVTQDIRASSSGAEVIVIDNGDANAVLYSSDGGIIFSEKKITSALPAGAFARYGAIPSSSTWYVTLGNWPRKNQTRTGDYFPLSARLSRHKKTGRAMREDMTKRVGKATESNSYSAVIVRTTDGGSTWSTVFSDTTHNFYFNMIDCASTTVCTAVGEGFDAGAGVHVYHTADGGNSWQQVFTLSSSSSSVYSLMAVKYVNANEVWAAGSEQKGFSALALFLVSTDGGRTWTKTNGGVQNIGDVTDMSFVDGVGFATAVTIFDDSTVLKYSTGPAPTPVPGSSFIQMDCTDAACSQNCRNLTFAAGQCLEVNGGGSAVVHCGKGVLIETFYPDSKQCVGANKNSTMPLNKCLKSSGGGYFENFCPSGLHRASARQLPRRLF